MLVYVIGAISLVVCGGFTLFTLYHKFATGLAIPGWTSMIVIASFFGALNSLGIAVLGEYVVRIYDQVRARPSYIVARDVRATPLIEEQLPEEELLAAVQGIPQIGASPAQVAGVSAE
jgi:dolichol-phosphate mannosyltransferase